METSGINDPYTKIYITISSIENFALTTFIFLISQVTKFQYNSSLGNLVHKKEKKAFDSTPFVVGFITLLKQFHSSTTHKLFAYMGQYVRSLINATVRDQKNVMEYPEEVICLLLFVEDFCKLSNLDRKIIEGHLPSYILHNFSH